MPRQPRHTTLTSSAARAADALGRAGFLPHPGVIASGRAGGSGRVTVTVEPNRVRVAVSGNGHQDVLVYGPSERAAILRPLETEFGSGAIRVRDPYGLWEPPPEASAEEPPVPGRLP